MFNTIKFGKNRLIRVFFNSHIRHKSAKTRPKTTAKERALDHFDEFYGNYYGKHWPTMRECLLRRQKYVAVVNNYGNPEETAELLTNRGAHCLKHLMSVEKSFQNNNPHNRQNKSTKVGENKLNADIKLQDTFNSPDIKKETICETDKEQKQTKFKTLEESLSEAVIDESRIIDPSLGVTTEALYQYVPATELKGLEDYVLESSHYSYYNVRGDSKDFPLVIEQETEFNFPEHLKVYTYEKGSEYTMFSEPRRCNTGVFNYYALDSGSVLAVLALQLTAGDRLLDLCSAPGGKALIALQTFLPDIVVCNDISISRHNRINMIFKDYLADYETSNKWRERVMLTRVDGRAFCDDQGFDKVLVDVPCTTDRHAVSKLNDNNIFRPDRVRERLRMPELQSQLLAFIGDDGLAQPWDIKNSCTQLHASINLVLMNEHSNALRLVKVGGAVVYSTCSLSPVQNDGVVHMALKHVFETHDIVANVKDLSPCMKALDSTAHYATGAIAPKYGQLILPSPEANFGPMYVARLVRVR